MIHLYQSQHGVVERHCLASIPLLPVLFSISLLLLVSSSFLRVAIARARPHGRRLGGSLPAWSSAWPRVLGRHRSAGLRLVLGFVGESRWRRGDGRMAVDDWSGAGRNRRVAWSLSGCSCCTGILLDADEPHGGTCGYCSAETRSTLRSAWLVSAQDHSGDLCICCPDEGDVAVLA